MEYTVQKLGLLAGVSTRTLRYYDEIGILKPARINSSGYRIYGPSEVDRLQQILFYRELGVTLEEIKEILASPGFDAISALREHKKNLLEKREHLDTLIANVDLTLAEKEGIKTMSDKQKFEGFKQKQIDDNERQYGEEIRAKYGEQQINKSYQKLKGMTEEEHARLEGLANEILQTLVKAMETKDPAGELAQKTVELHRQWLSFYWAEYSKEAHMGLAQMYVDDPRFTAYYDKERPGAAVFLRDAVSVYASKE